MGTAGCIGWIVMGFCASARLSFIRQLQVSKLSVAVESTTAETWNIPPHNANNADNPTGLYFHVPFCRKRCRYCDFAIVPVGPEPEESSAYLQMAQDYTKAVLLELETLQPDDPVSIKSVYLGGGTPSLAPTETLAAFAQAIQLSTQFRLDRNAEWTIEVDPGTFDIAKLRSLRDLGFNRFSLGVQSFDDALLESLGRTHRLHDIQASIAMLLDVFGEEVNYSIDLISAIPGLSLAQWTDTLETAISLHPRPRHISIYDLQIESGTVFGKWYDANKADDDRPSSPLARPLPSGADAAFMYRYASGYLAASGYEHYEVSSYALLPESGNVQPPSPWRSKHNQLYWAVKGQWFAFGLGATSFVNSTLQSRPRALFDYYQWVEMLQSRGRVGDDEHSTTPSELDQMQDIVLKRLRTSEGLNLYWVRDRDGGKEVVKAIRKGAALAFEMGLAKEEGSWLRLTDPDGLLFSNTIISNIFVELERLFNE